MLEVSRVGVAESDDEIDLSLELSIGGSYGKLKKLKQADHSGKENGKGLKAVVPRSGFSFPEMVVGDQMDTESGSGSEVVDSRRIREIQALRRQEARKKREEKLRKSAANSKGINAGAFAVGIANANDKVVLETQQFQAKVRDREMRENDALLEEKIAKFNRNENGKDSNFTFRNDRTGSEDRVSGSKPSVSFLQNVPVKKRPYPYPQLQCMPQKNGFVYPPMVPCRGPRVSKKENDTKGRNIFQSVSCGSFRPYPTGNGNLKHDSGTSGCDSERHSAKSESGIPKVMPNGSLERSSSAISDHPSTSGKGGSSSETGSHSSFFRTNEQQLGVSSINFDRMAQPGTIACAGKRELEQDPRKSADRSCMAEVSRNDKTVATPKCDEPSTSTSRPSNGNKGTLVPTLPRMPCVSTTGNGPNGKTITGFLYRYTKTEVSIVCVCHGSSFSPAEFVEHAGGTDVTNPLRHITMVPSSFAD